MRVDFGGKEKQREFFRNAKEDRTWEQLYELVVCELDSPPTFRTFQNWYKCNYLPALEVVKVICDLTHRAFAHLDVKLRDEIWGRSKGGKRKMRIYGCNLTMEERIRGTLSLKLKLENEISDK